MDISHRWQFSDSRDDDLSNILYTLLCLGFKLMETIILYFEGTKKASLN